MCRSRRDLPGQHIRLAGQGDHAPAPATSRAICYIEVEFQPHPLYRVDGARSTMTLPVAPWEAMLGATVKTPTPGGAVDLKIPPARTRGVNCASRAAASPPRPRGPVRGAGDRAAARCRCEVTRGVRRICCRVPIQSARADRSVIRC